MLLSPRVVKECRARGAWSAALLLEGDRIENVYGS